MTKGTIPTYLDFELRIGTGGSNCYPVTVIHSPAGEASGEFHWWNRPNSPDCPGPWGWMD